MNDCRHRTALVLKLPQVTGHSTSECRPRWTCLSRSSPRLKLGPLSSPKQDPVPASHSTSSTRSLPSWSFGLVISLSCCSLTLSCALALPTSYRPDFLEWVLLCAPVMCLRILICRIHRSPAWAVVGSLTRGLLALPESRAARLWLPADRKVNPGAAGVCSPSWTNNSPLASSFRYVVSWHLL